MLSCAITDGKSFGLVNATQFDRLQSQMRQWAADGIGIIQIREKHLDAGDLLALAETALHVLREMNSSAKLVINGRADVAIAARAHGVHLTARRDELVPRQVRSLFERAGLPSPVVTVSCHAPEEIARAREQNADCILFGPVFEKRVAGEVVVPGVGLENLREACELAQPVPVLALGGITLDNAVACVAAGAAGVAGIRTLL